MKFLKMKEGFTLVELMVVVAIIGVLSAVAVPNFKKYQAKSKTSEAKLHLAAIYTAEQAFSSDYDTFGTCLVTMGYNPDNESMQRFYTTGFSTAGSADTFSTATTNGASTCISTDSMSFAAGKRLGNTAPATATALPTTTAGVTNFLAGAAGFIHTDNTTNETADKWTIDQNKSLMHTIVGY